MSGKRNKSSFKQIFCISKFISSLFVRSVHYPCLKLVVIMGEYL